MACLGLVKAVDGYDPDLGHAFLSYAVPTITGELKRHLRDRTTLVRLPRSVQEAGQRVRRARQELEQAHGGRPPTPAEIAEASGLSPSAVAEAIRSRGAAQPLSLEASPQGAVRPLPAFADVVGDRDPGIEAVTDRVELIRAMRQFPERERRILVLRFFHDQTQQQIAAAVGVSTGSRSHVWCVTASTSAPAPAQTRPEPTASHAYAGKRSRISGNRAAGTAISRSPWGRDCPPRNKSSAHPAATHQGAPTPANRSATCSGRQASRHRASSSSASRTAPPGGRESVIGPT